jgi:small neutral amino acid transporter SnatA (MarC family)
VTDALLTAAGVLATLAPLALVPGFLALPRAEDDGTGVRLLAWGVVAAAGVFAAVIALTDTFLGVLDIAPESFQGAAAVIMLPLAAQLLWTGRSLDPGARVTRRPWLMPLAVPGLVGPASLAAVVAYTGRYGEAEAAGGTLIALAVAAAVLLAGGWLRERIGGFALGILGRLSGAFIVVIALDLVVDGVRSV